MVTGVECAGLVLAVLPLFIEAGKAYSDGVETILDISLVSRRDAKLSDFYDEFYWAVSELGEHITDISSAISNSTIGRQQPSSSLQLSEWSQDSEVEKRLKAYFGSDTAFNKFTVTAKRIVQLLAQLLKDEVTYIEEKDLDESVMFNKLEAFALSRDSKKTKISFMERFKFFRKEKHRDKCLERLKLWNERLHGLIHRAQAQGQNAALVSKTPDERKSPIMNTLIYGIRNPSAPVRTLTRNLYTALSSCWKCNCNGGHEAKLCLNIQNATEKTTADTAADFDFLMSAPASENETLCWQEGTISIRSASQLRDDGEAKLTKVCDALKMCMKDFRLRILMEDMNGQQSLWRLDPRPRRIHFLETESPVSLRDLLLGSAKMGPREKRELGLICTYSLLLFHDSPWLSKGWNKTNLSFFYKLDNEPDFLRPYLSTRFEVPAREVGQIGSGVFHRNSHILALAILLVEIFNEKPIEVWRNVQERTTITASTEPNINLKVASRVVKKMDSSPYRSAIEACLDLDWLPEGRKVTLEDVEVRSGLYSNVIQPLEKELEYISQTLLSNPRTAV